MEVLYLVLVPPSLLQFVDKGSIFTRVLESCGLRRGTTATPASDQHVGCKRCKEIGIIGVRLGPLNRYRTIIKDVCYAFDSSRKLSVIQLGVFVQMVEGKLELLYKSFCSSVWPLSTCWAEFPGSALMCS